MKSVYIKIQQQAIRIAERYPASDFYADYAEQMDFSVDFFSTDAVVCDLHKFVAGEIDDDFGHGLDHVRKVAMDAGALAIIEWQNRGWQLQEQKLPEYRRVPFAELAHQVRMAQCAGLLHDIRRKEENHAKAGAVFAEKILADFAFSPAEVTDICIAIGNHEAYRETEACRCAAGELLSDCLYDADKFRWGTENFTHTVWAMVAYSNMPIKKFVHLYPKGVSFLEKIKSTFRTPTGRRYGPQFIDIGLQVGEDVYQYIQQEFAEYL